MITYRGEQIEVWDAHAHMGERQQLAIHQVPRIMAFMPDEMIARMDESAVDVVTPFPIGAGNKTDYAESNRLMAEAAREHPGRMVGYLRLNPNYGVEHNRGLIEEGVRLGLRGELLRGRLLQGRRRRLGEGQLDRGGCLRWRGRGRLR